MSAFGKAIKEHSWFVPIHPVLLVKSQMSLAEGPGDDVGLAWCLLEKVIIFCLCF